MAHVLLVEDEPALRRALGELLALRGHAVTTASDVASALRELETRPSIECVVTDLGLPGRSGWDVVAAVRARARSLPVVVLSGCGVAADEDLAAERGAAVVLTKPTSEDELARVIESLVNPGARAPG